MKPTPAAINRLLRRFLRARGDTDRERATERTEHARSIRRLKRRINRLPDMVPPKDLLLRCGRPIRMIYWPHYPNPYQPLFYGSACKGYDAVPGTIDEAIACLNSDGGRETVCFHLHWLNSIVLKTHSTAEAWEAVRSFTDKLSQFRSQGGILLWTIHNLVSHDTPHEDADIELGRRVADLCDIVILHGKGALTDARDLYAIASGKELVAPHGSYVDIYPNSVSRQDARRRLGIPKERIVYLTLGLVRPYKGIERFIDTLANIEAPPRTPQIVIAGKPLGVSAGEYEKRAAGRVALTLDLRHIPDVALQTYLNAADWMVLPYRRILTSGSALLALSFSLPVIAPRLGLLPELITNGEDGFLYDDKVPEALGDALKRAMAVSGEPYRKMSETALQTARSRMWSKGRAEMLQRVIRISEERRPT